MKITIDTTVDSHEDIQKVLQILHHVVQKKETSSYNEPTQDTTNMMSMFSTEEKKEIPDTAPDFSSFLNLNEKKEDKEPKLEFF